MCGFDVLSQQPCKCPQVGAAAVASQALGVAVIWGLLMNIITSCYMPCQTMHVVMDLDIINEPQL